MSEPLWASRGTAVQVELLSLDFPAGLHLGAAGLGTESVRPTVPADTLFSALLATWVRMGRDPRAWVDPFLSRPPFLLTSAFPRVGSILFFPKPLGYRPAGVPQEEEKDWKRVAWVSEAVLNRIRTHGEKADVWPKKEAKARLLQGGALLLSAQEVVTRSDDEKKRRRVWMEEEVPRVALDRVTSASNLFSVGRVRFSRGCEDLPPCGLWFGVAWVDPERDCDGMSFREAFDLALGELGAHGLGGDRSVGYGTFRAEVLDSAVRWKDPRSGEYVVLLSRYHPRPEELPAVLRTAQAYQLELLRGWGSSAHRSFRRRSLWLIREGSVIRHQGEGPMGDLVDLAPEGERNPGHPVWRYGLALGLPLEVACAGAD